jgi:hypothetical protein
MYNKHYKYYTVLDEKGDSRHVTTYRSSDGIELIIAEDVAYTEFHGPMASIGFRWEFAEPDWEYNPCLAQIAVDTINGAGETFNSAEYRKVLDGHVSFLRLFEQ